MQGERCGEIADDRESLKMTRARWSRCSVPSEEQPIGWKKMACQHQHGGVQAMRVQERQRKRGGEEPASLGSLLG